MQIKELISQFLLDTDTARFKVEGIDYFFCQEKDLCIVEKLTRDVYLKLLELLDAKGYDVLYVTSHEKKPDAFSSSYLTSFYSVTFRI